MNSRERVTLALNHQEPDYVPLDLGASAVTGMHVSSVYLLRQALRLDPPGTPVKVIEPYQMLGEIAPDLIAALGVDVVGLGSRQTLFGFRNEGWKPWTLFDGTPVLVPAGFNTEPEEDGSILMYPEGDRTAPPSGRMPAGGFYFDTIIRQEPIDEARLDPADRAQGRIVQHGHLVRAVWDTEGAIGRAHGVVQPEPGGERTPVVFVTSLTDFESRANSTISGGNDLIAKPFLFIELAVKTLVYVLRCRLETAKESALQSR